MSSASYKDYQEVYQQLQSVQGRFELGDDPVKRTKIEEKLESFANDYQAWRSQEKPSAQQIFDLPLKDIIHKAISTLADIVEDFHQVLIRRHELSAAAIRRKLTHAVMRKDRRMYVGIWVVLIAFVVYFLDASV